MPINTEQTAPLSHRRQYMLDKLSSFGKRHKEALIVGGLLLISGIAHGYNMFGFPYYENDEGVYLSQAWSLLTQHKLSPYTYWYDHAPGGWILIAFWLMITRYIYLFGFALNSGRVFMLVMHLASTWLVFKIGKKLTSSWWPGIIATLLFSLSPLSIYFQRRLLLDNIMIFWVLLAYYLLLGTKRRLSHYILSALALAVAVLSKENAVVFVPGFLILLWKSAHSHHRRFAVATWVLVFFSLVSTYFLYAILKGEFFPAGTALGGNSQHVSLLETLKYQSTREGVSNWDLKNGSFWVYLRLWFKQDPVFVALGILSNLGLLIWAGIKKNWVYLSWVVMCVSFWAFLARGGIVIEFYILPLLPLLALGVGIWGWEILKRPKWLMVIFGVAILGYYLKFGAISRAFPQYNPQRNIYTSQQTKGQIEAVKWIKENIDPEATIVIDNYSYLDLHIPQNSSDKVFSKAHWYWKVNQDPQIKGQVFQNSPQSIDYVAQTPQMKVDLLKGISLLTSSAVSNAHMIESFNSDGWGVDIFITQFPQNILARTWESYKRTFMIDDEQSTDNGITTSEGQSYALLRAVWQDDKPTFDKVWKWTKANLQNEVGTFAWKYGEGKVLDKGSATDADSDIAVALLFAAKSWQDETYLEEARFVLKGLWETEVRNFYGTNYLIPGNWAKEKEDLYINPSYLSPYAYRIFAQADLEHPWMDLVDSSYKLLSGCTESPLEKRKSAHLPPDWCGMSANGQFHQLQETGLTSTNYSYDALRVNWRVALDYVWFKEERAMDYLLKSASFFLNEWYQNRAIPTAFSHDGPAWGPSESVLGLAAVIANFTVTNPDVAADIYEYKVISRYFENPETGVSYWEDPNNYYAQNWAWFGTGLYFDRLENLYH